MPFSLLATKWHCPALPDQQLPRPHLLARFTQGLALGHNLTVVVAPAGFGKTTLVSQWIHQNAGWGMRNAESGDATPTLRTPNAGALSGPRNQVVWLSLDEYDNALDRFLQYLVEAIQHVFPAACANCQQLLDAPELPPLPDLATLLINDLAAPSAAYILVLEDYHLIEEAAIHQLLTRVLDHLPPAVHLILTSRTEPPLPLARLRLRRQLTELRSADLGFSLAETKAFLTQAVGRPLVEETVAALQTQTEGWIAGLQLAALALSARSDESAFVQAFQSSNRHVMDYLLEEVLIHQPQPVQQFLLYTSILDRFCTPLCEAILSEGVENSPLLPHSSTPLPNTGSQPILPYLVQTHLFIVPLDEHGEWYRYHHLFRELLRHHLRHRVGAAEIAALHRQASAWLARHNFIEEAIQQALAAKDYLSAARLIEQHRQTLLNREAWPTLERWLALLPAEWVQERPNLLVAQALILFFHAKTTAIPSLLEAAEARLALAGESDGDVRALRGEINLLWSHVLGQPHELPRSLAAAQQALEQLPATYLYARSRAFSCLGLTLQMTGQFAQAVQTLQTALDEQAAPNTFTARVLFTLATIYYAEGAFTRVQQTAHLLWQMATQSKLPLSLVWAHCLLGIVAYEWNELATAAQHFAAVLERRYTAHAVALHNSWLGLALTAQAQGQFDEARQQGAALLQFHQATSHRAFLPAANSLQVRLALQQGDAATAFEWVQTTTLNSTPANLLTLEIPQLTRAKILLHQATTASLAEAVALLEQLCEFAETLHNTVSLVEILALQALVATSQGQPGQALVILERAVTLAKPGRFLRTFVALGPPLAALLYQLAARGVEAAYLGQVLAAFPTTSHTDDPTRRAQRPAQANLIEPLTERELEVLALLARHFSNQEIAQALTISPLTVRNHTTNLYQKLSVKSRKQAVAQARTLGLLPAES